MSNDDIVERLRRRPWVAGRGSSYVAELEQQADAAADEIERLRADIADALTGVVVLLEKVAALRAAGDRLAEVLADYEGGRGPGDALRVDGATGWSVWIVGHDVVDAPTIRDALIAAVRRVADEVTR